MTKEKEDRFIEFCANNGFDISSLDSKQREAVLSDKKFIIPAGAGSGKTTVLSYRFLRLVMDGIHSDEILTMTFTKDATASMRGKIYTILNKAYQKGLIEEDEIKRFTNAEICTTDSFCAKILRSDCIRYGFAPNFKVEDSLDSENFVRSTMRKIIEEKCNEEENEGIKALLEKKSLDTIINAYIDIYNNYFNITTPLKNNEKEFIDYYNSRIKDALKKEASKEKDKLILLINSFITENNDNLPAQEAISLVNRLKDAITKNTIFKEKIDLRKKALQVVKFQLEKIREQIQFYYQFAFPFLSDDNYPILSTYASLLYRMEKEAFMHKRESGLLSFHDVLLLSIDILKTNNSLRKQYCERFKKIMVDEFQDNNEDNKRLIYLLASKDSFTENDYPTINDIDKTKIFMVGDEKQSIYRFRGADVSVFKNISRDFGEEAVLSLTRNFRSEESLINKINNLFSSSIMPRPEEANEEEGYEAVYTPLESSNKRIPSSEIKFLCMKDEKIKEAEEENPEAIYASKVQAEAYAVASFIKNKILGEEKEKYQVSSKGKSRDPKLEDIAILLRSASNQSDFERALRKFGLSFNVSENKSLTRDALFYDFYSILQLIIYDKANDPISYASLLRSPFINMSDNDIENAIRNLNENLNLKTTEEGEKKVDEAEKLINEVKEIVKKGKIANVIDYIYNEKGYRLYVESLPSNYIYKEHYEYLYALANTYDEQNRGIVSFVDRIRENLGSDSSFKDLSIQDEVKSGITIQTIHKSKGLEYPIVIVANMAAGRGNEKMETTKEKETELPILPFFKTKDGIVNPYAKLKKISETKIENAETKRMLYVAATRAENHLIFSSNLPRGTFDSAKNNKMIDYLMKGINSSDSLDIERVEFKPVKVYEFFEVNKTIRKENNWNKWYEKPLERNIKEEIKKIGVTTLIEEESINSSILVDSTKITKEDGKKLPLYPSDTILSSIDDSLLIGIDENEKEEKRKELREERIASFGTLTHTLLEDSIKGEESDLSSFFPLDKERNVLIEQAKKLRDEFLSSSFYSQIKNTNLSPEKAFLVFDNGRIVEGKIDLLSIDENTVRIIDYKTDSISYPTSHSNQLKYYMNAIKKIYPDKNIEGYVIYLRDIENPIEIKMN